MSHNISERNDGIHSLRSKRFSLFIFVVVVWFWGFLIMSSIREATPPFLLLAPLILALPLLILALRFARSARGLQGSPLFSSKRQVWYYAAIVTLTLVGYVLGATITRAIHHPLDIIPIATIIIGLHFLALVPIFKDRVYYLTAVVFCLAAILPVLIGAQSFMLGPLHVDYGWQLITGCICCLWLWVIAIWHLIKGTALLRQMKNAQIQETETLIHPA